MRVTKALRGKPGAGSLDLAPIADFFARRQKAQTAMGIVSSSDDNQPHFEVVVNDAGDVIDVTVDVDLMPSGRNITCRLMPGTGRIPAAGAEVAVIIPGGDATWMPICLGPLAYGASDRLGTDRHIIFAPDRIEVIAPVVYISSDGAAGSPVATLADIQDLRGWAASHTHSGVTTGSGSSLGPVVSPPTPDGTSVLKAE